MGATLLLCGIAIACLEHKSTLVWNWIGTVKSFNRMFFGIGRLEIFIPI